MNFFKEETEIPKNFVPTKDTHVSTSEDGTHEMHKIKNHHNKYYAGYIAISIIVLLIIISMVIMVVVMYFNKTYVFSNELPGPAPNTGLYQPNVEYFNTTLTPEQIQKKQAMIDLALEELKIP